MVYYVCNTATYGGIKTATYGGIKTATYGGIKPPRMAVLKRGTHIIYFQTSFHIYLSFRGLTDIQKGKKTALGEGSTKSSEKKVAATQPSKQDQYTT